MAWRVKLRPSVIKELNKLPKPAQERILIFLESLPTDPRSKGKAIKTGKNEPPMWRYRAGDYRIVCYL
ncbi:MAG TPA: type II toxin-antitoxin system RelE/ParE family toxin, partial [Nitrospirae bacterium]|nr:type II toxin-antitoxin system RelE/ParE family toxin [Nitrospirota bacterium]